MLSSIADHFRAGPMKETDWDYVFQANKVLSCSYVDGEDAAYASQ